MTTFQTYAWIDYCDKSACERGGSANIGYTRTCALRFDMAAQPLVDLSALRQMYSTAATLSIVYSQEVCGTEEKVGGMGIMCSGIENK